MKRVWTNTGPVPFWGDRRQSRIGLLGGSFNPAHDGHRYISLEALRRFRLDEVWWLVTPQNPLKGVEDMAPHEERLAEAVRVANHPQIAVSDIETHIGSTYTLNTLKFLVKRYPNVDFVWLMGADNLEQISKWEGWKEIFHTMPIAVFPRPSYSLRALASRAPHVFRDARVSGARMEGLAGIEPPAWAFVPTREVDLSGTELRAKRRVKAKKPKRKPNRARTNAAVKG